MDRWPRLILNQERPAVITNRQAVNVRLTCRVRGYVSNRAIKGNFHQAPATAREGGVVVGSVQRPGGVKAQPTDVNVGRRHRVRGYESCYGRRRVNVVQPFGANIAGRPELAVVVGQGDH